MKLVATSEKVQIKWFVWTGGEKFPKTANMRGEWGYDAHCSCGYQTRTGGAVKSYVQKMVDEHKLYDHDYTWELSERKSTFDKFVNELKEAGINV